MRSCWRNSSAEKVSPKRSPGVDINPLYTHFMREIWPDPDRFDPLRFDPEASRARHKFAYVPFGGGAPMCLGLNFASMQAKCFNVCVSIATDYRPSGECGQFRIHATDYR
jgi:Cytochrome P450